MEENVLTMTDDEFVDKHKNLVHHIVWRRFGKSLSTIQSRTNLEYEDLVQYGMMGLIKARQRFDPNYGYKFSTYAVPTILGEINRWLRDSNYVRVSRSIIETKQLIDSQKLSDKTPKEISEILDISESIVRDTLNYNPHYVSMSQSAYSNEEGSDLDLESMLENPENPIDIEKEVADRNIVSSFLATLTDLERRVWYLYNKDDLSQVVVGNSLGITQAQVSRILNRVNLKAIKYGKMYNLNP